MNRNEVKIINAILSAITSALMVITIPLVFGMLFPPLGKLWMPATHLSWFWPLLGGLGTISGGAVWLFKTSQVRGFNPDRFLRSAYKTAVPIVLAALVVFLLATAILAFLS